MNGNGVAENQLLMQSARIIHKGTYGLLDVFGPTVEFLTSSNEADAIYSVILGTIPPGVSIPLHSHADVESFFMLSGTVQVLSYVEENFKWLDA
jgi:quercetin dioxygenase-like cupin family protein